MKTTSLNILFKITALIIIDSLCAALAVYMSVFIRFEIEYAALPIGTMEKVCEMLVYWLPVNFIIFVLFKMYRRLWEYASIREGLRVVLATSCSFFTLVAINEVMHISSHRSCYPLIWIFYTALALGTRFFYRIVRVIKQELVHGAPECDVKNVMIIGAGNAGNSIIREIERDRRFLKYHVVCVIDDDPKKQNKYIGRIKVVGNRIKIIWAAQKYNVDEIIFAIPSADSETRHIFFDICKDTSCVIKTLPSYYQMIGDKATLSMLKRVEIADLLERPQIKLELNRISELISGKTVLVTGAGGSIGSELCRQLARYNPAKLILFDIYENSVYFIQNELKESFPKFDIVTLIGSVRDVDRLDYVFSTYKPDIVYHAAAHKHVPLMEESPNEAIKNNVFGTLNTVKAADKYGVSRFVMISTDKAVNPTNIMGTTKRICEMIIQTFDRHSKTDFVAVRFGNVLGSNGSVIPIFEKQIEKGGPITVTHPDIIRYFMTIPEAVSLVLQAGSNAKGGEIFILDMGKPVKILSLAENMIRLSGLVPYKDINIVYTGLRPGEKIFEELLMNEEGIAETQHEQIFVGKPMDIDEMTFLQQLKHLEFVLEDESFDVRTLLHEIVPTFHSLNITKNGNNDMADEHHDTEKVFSAAMTNAFITSV